MTRISIAFASLLGVAVSLHSDAALAQPISKEQKRDAEAHSNAGVRLYNVGRFGDAIVEFDKAYQTVPHPTLLFNLGKAHWRNGASDKALFVFRRYLQTAPVDDPDRPKVEKQIKEIEVAIQAEKEKSKATALVPPPVSGSVARPPAISKTIAASATAVPPAVVGGGPTDLHQAANSPEPVGNDRRIRILVAAGIAQPHLEAPTGVRRDSLNLDAKGMFAATVAVTYAIPFTMGAIDVGVMGSWSPISYKKSGAARGQEGRSNLVGALATSALRFRVNEAFSIGPVLGAGMVWWTGLEAGNPFTAGQATAAVQMPTFRGGLTSGFAVAPSVSLGIDLGAAYSRPSGVLAQAVPSMLCLEASAAVGFLF